MNTDMFVAIGPTFSGILLNSPELVDPACRSPMQLYDASNDRLHLLGLIPPAPLHHRQIIIRIMIMVIIMMTIFIVKLLGGLGLGVSDEQNEISNELRVPDQKIGLFFYRLFLWVPMFEVKSQENEYAIFAVFQGSRLNPRLPYPPGPPLSLSQGHGAWAVLH